MAEFTNSIATGFGYSQVISVGACGWTCEWYWPDFTSPDDMGGRYRLWWLKDTTYGFNDVADDATGSRLTQADLALAAVE